LWFESGSLPPFPGCGGGAAGATGDFLTVYGHFLNVGRDFFNVTGDF